MMIREKLPPPPLFLLIIYIFVKKNGFKYGCLCTCFLLPAKVMTVHVIE